MLRGSKTLREGGVLLLVERRPAVERDPMVIIDLPFQRLLGLAERIVPFVARGLRLGRHNQRGQQKHHDAFVHADTSLKVSMYI